MENINYKTIEKLPNAICLMSIPPLQILFQVKRW